jgi:hypothetical protein
MRHFHKAAALVLITASLAVAFPAGDRERAELALDLAQALAENRERLQAYSWHSKMEVTIDGERQVLRTELVRYGENGRLQREVLAASELPGAGKTIETELGRGVRQRLRAAIDAYGHPSAGSLVDFFEDAEFAPVLEGADLSGALRIHGSGLLRAGDHVTMVVDLAERTLHALSFSTTLEGKAYQVSVTYEQLPDGPFYAHSTEVKAPAAGIEGRVSATDMKLREAAGDSPPESATAAVATPAQGWPREYEVKGSKLILHQPQLQSWPKRRTLEAVAAVEVVPYGQEAGAVGALRLRARTRLRATDRSVLIDHLKVLELRFPGEDAAREEELVKLTKTLLPKRAQRVPLEQLQAALEEAEQLRESVEVSLEPPRVIVSRRPAVLVTVDGQPELVQTGVPGLFQVINTEWTLFSRPGQGYALYFNEGWLLSKDLKGPWTPGPAPAEIGQLPDEPRWKEARGHVPGTSLNPQRTPQVTVATQPAELIVTDGEPRYVPIRGTGLLYVSNTEDDLLYHTQERLHYLLLAGRWFCARALEGPWETVGDDLPRDMSRIPADHAMARVLPAVPGTPQAEEAVLLAEVPRRAKVKRSEASLEVTYQGKPKLRAIGDTGVAYAVNTVFDVLRVGGRYYCCYQGVWFEAPGPTGPWELCLDLPEAIYAIPSSSPKYHVRYVHVGDYDDDYCWYWYGAGYLGAYYYGGVVLYGTGWYHPYPPHYWSHYHWGYYPVSGGTAYHAFYGPRVSAYGHSSYYYAPYGTYVRSSAWGTVNGRPVSAYREAAFGPYSSWGRGVVSHDGGWAQWGRVSTQRGTRIGVRDSAGGRGVAGTGPRGTGGAYRSGNGDLYVGRDGNVYRRSADGWQRRSGGTWKDAERPTRPRPERRTGRDSNVDRDLDRTRRARDRARSRERPTWQGSGNGAARQPAQPNRPRTRYPSQPRARGGYGGARRGGGGFRGGGGGGFRGAGS